MSDRSNLASLVTQSETRAASTGLLVIGAILGGSAVSVVFWYRSRRASSLYKSLWHRSGVGSHAEAGYKFICVLDGLSKPCRRDAVEVATCFGVTDVWVVANADASDLRDDFKQTQTGSVFSANGLTITMRIFATAQECCDELVSDGWTICIASSEPGQAELHGNKVAVVAAEPFPSQAFIQAARGATASKSQLPAVAALALTLQHCTSRLRAQPHQESSRSDARTEPEQASADSNHQPKQTDGPEDTPAESTSDEQSCHASDKQASLAASSIPEADAAASGDAPFEPQVSDPSTAATDTLNKDGREASSAESPQAEPESSEAHSPESASHDPQHVDSASDSRQAQPAQQGSGPVHDSASGPERPADAAAPTAGTCSGSLAQGTAGADNGLRKHADDEDDAASVRSQDTSTSRSSKLHASERSRLQAQAMRRSGVMRRHGGGGQGGSYASSSMGSPTGSVASVSTSGWPETSPFK